MADPGPAATPAPSPTPVVPPSEAPAGPPPEALQEAAASRESLPEALPEATEEESAGPQRIQREALDLCQSASEPLRKGEREKAIQAVDQAYQRMLSSAGERERHVPPGQGRHPPADRRPAASGLREAAPAAVALADLGVPIVNNEHVRRELKSFTTVERDFFVEAYRRSGLYRPMILAKPEAAQLPAS